MIPIAKPMIGKEEIAGVVEVLKSGIIAQGTKVKELEEKFARYIGTNYAIAVNSGTAALHVALLAHGIKYGDEVITTPFSFIATANSILYCNAKPVFADVREDDFNIDPSEILEKISAKTKAILIVHLYGQACDMKTIMEIAEDHKIALIEDACQAHGAIYDGRKVGSFGTGTFSFYSTKNITTGEGGMVTSDDDAIAEKIRMLREHGSRRRYYHEILGYNYRMTDISAAIGLAQFKKMEKFNRKRIENAACLTRMLNGIKGIIAPKILEKRNHVFHQYTIRVTNEFGVGRDELVKILNEKGISTGIYYPLPIHKQPLYKNLGYGSLSLPVSDKLSGEVLSLPIHPAVRRKDLEHIANTIKNVEKGGRERQER